MTVGRIFTKIYIFISLFWAFFRKPENSGLTPGQNDDPDVKDDPFTRAFQFAIRIDSIRFVMRIDSNLFV